MKTFNAILCGTLMLANGVFSLQLDLNDDESIKKAAKTAATGMLTYYHPDQPGQIPGLLVQPYYWWEAGAMFGALIDYWHFTGDGDYNQLVTDGMMFQRSATNDFMPPNQTKSLGNDDQAFWGMAAMMAAEVGFPNPPKDKPSWIQLAEGVFYSQTKRWDTTSCKGGLFWQVNSLNLGYTYKNSISQGGLLNIAARLGAYTKEQHFFDWVDKIWDWCASVHLIGPNYEIFDGTESAKGCVDVNRAEWSYNSAIFLHGAAVMWNQTTGDTQAKWRTRVQGLLDHNLEKFFTGPNNQTMIEQQCERNTPNTPQYCDTDQLSFKAYNSRWLTITTKLAPWTEESIMPYIRTSAMAAAQTCTGGSDGVTCGNRWWVTGWDGLFGAGQQMSALEVFQSNLAKNVQGPLSKDTGATSTGSANQNPDKHTMPGPITMADKAGAGVLTALVLVLFLGTAWWMIV